jgi:hypothetical protein
MKEEVHEVAWAWDEGIEEAWGGRKRRRRRRGRGGTRIVDDTLEEAIYERTLDIHSHELVLGRH